MQYSVSSLQFFRNLSRKFYFLVLCISLFSFENISAQFDIPKIPEEQTSVYDYASLLSASEKSSLEQKLIKYSDTTSTQIVVAIIPTAKGENIGLLSAKWAQEWGIGQAKEDNGVFVLLARDDRQIWISPGYGVEHKLTAGIVGELTRNVIIPEFKKGDYYEGLNKGTDAIFQVLMGEYQGSRQSTEDPGFPAGLIFFLFIIFIFILISISKNRKGGSGGSGNNKSGGFSILDAIILSNMGRGGFGGSSGGFGGSSGGGGFGGGFGGGGFSGGGAGGSW
ncbi:TPM domain-containing protein [Bizionia arctica]|uniref:Methanol dehydrogenase n=1 Tax=Bizionia arctica TaxID=1495645 RepID=A0A917LTU3_9FLAO|nr:TPM domain-containing protein [Bizionia arctica]GGG56566.1 methanol dehydrogenase [Bizionia arctica]